MTLPSERMSSPYAGSSQQVALIALSTFLLTCSAGGIGSGTGVTGPGVGREGGHEAGDLSADGCRVVAGPSRHHVSALGEPLRRTRRSAATPLAGPVGLDDVTCQHALRGSP
jgi:hypothetical protein